MIYELKKDMLIGFIMLSNANFYMQWAIVYPYLGSYLKNFMPGVTFNAVFSCILAIYLGMFLGNLILPRIFFILGLRKTLQLASVLYFLNMTAIYMFPSFPAFVLNMTVVGIVVSFYFFTFNCFFSQKYENGIMYTPFVFMGVPVGTFIWPFVISLMVNPSNREMDTVSPFDSSGEMYYSYDISQNISGYLNLHGTITMVINVVLAHFLSNPEGYHSRITMWLAHKITKDQLGSRNYEDEYKAFRRSTINQISVSFAQSVNKFSIMSLRNSIGTNRHNTGDKIVELIEKGEVEKQIKDEAEADEIYQDVKQIMVSTQFISLMFVAITRTAASLYFTSNYKYMATFIVKNDRLSSFIYSLTAITEILGRCAGPILWEKLAFFNTYILIISSSIFCNALFMLLGNSVPFVYLLLSFIERFVTGLNQGVGNVTLFSLYGPDRAMYLYKIYDNVSFLSLFYGVLLNNLFVSDGHFGGVFAVFLIVEVAMIGVMYKNLRNV